MCKSSNNLVVDVVLIGNDNLFCLAIGHTGHMKDCLEDKDFGKEDIPFIFIKGTYPSLWCHKRSTFYMRCRKYTRFHIKTGSFISMQ